MRILVIGAGALGGYFGACLVRAGNDVTFLVRARRAEQLSRDRLTIISPHGDFAVTPQTVLANDLTGPFDVVLVCVKSYSLGKAMEEFASAVGPETMVLPILNGLMHVDQLTSRFGVGRVLGGLANISAGLDADGRILLFWPNQELVLGELGGGLSDRSTSLALVFKEAGIDARASARVMHDMWEKFVQLSTLAGITCLMRASLGDILEVPGGREAIFGLFNECCKISGASGFEPSSPFLAFEKEFFTVKGSPLKASMLRDIERGSVTEGEHILGDMAIRARTLGLNSPVLDLARANVAAYELGRAKLSCKKRPALVSIDRN